MGGSSALARRIRVRSQAVSQWDRVPAERVLAVEEATGVKAHELRPDLYREPSGVGEDAARERSTQGHFTRFKHLRRDRYKSAEEIEEYIRALRDEWSHR